MAIDDLESLVIREYDLILKTIHSFLARSPISQPFQAVLWEALARLSPQRERLPKSSLTILLPRLTYLTCGGQKPFPTAISAAWYLFYVAADLMDGIQDQDLDLVQQSNDFSPPVWLNLASAYFFLANLLLDDLLSKEIEEDAGKWIVRAFHEKLMQMCDGQYDDLTSAEFHLSDYLKMLRKKSGSFFSLACCAGARMATDHAIILERMAQFGSHLGCIVQILDDLEDWREIQTGKLLPAAINSLHKNLAVIYTQEVLPEADKSAFRAAIASPSKAPEEWQTVVDWVNRAGAALYTITLLTQEAESAIALLQDDFFVSLPKESLIEIVRHFVGEK